MFSIDKPKAEVSRRSLMQGMAAAGLGASALPASLSAAESGSTRKKVVRLFLPFGISHLDSFDPKPDCPELMGDTKVIRSNTGEMLSAYFPNLAKCMDKFTLVRSMRSPEGDHGRAQYLNITSYPLLGTTSHPDFGAWMQKLSGTLNENLPSSVSIRNGNGGGGFLGSNYDPLKLNDANNALRGLVMKDPKSDETLERLRLMADVRKNFHANNRTEKSESYRSFYNDSIKFMQSSDLVAFDLKKESPAMLKKYSVNHGMQFLLARRLLQADVQYVSLAIGGWDHHNDLWGSSFPTQARELDTVLAIFINDLHDQGLFKDTILTVNSDFGRSPIINVDKGRHHHPKAFTSIIAGAGVKNGIVYGKSDEQGMKVVENTVSPADFTATLATIAGLNVEKEIFSPDNRPFTIARGGKVVKGLMA
jgi:hypothetical protein